MSTQHDGFKLGTLAGEPVTLPAATVPRSLRNAVEHFANRHPEGRDAALAELLERGLHHRFFERMADTFRRELEPHTLAAKREKAKS